MHGKIDSIVHTVQVGQREYDYLDGRHLMSESKAIFKVLGYVYPLGVKIVRELMRQGYSQPDALKRLADIVQEAPKNSLKSYRSPQVAFQGDDAEESFIPLNFSYPNPNYLENVLRSLKKNRPGPSTPAKKGGSGNAIIASLFVLGMASVMRWLPHSHTQVRTPATQGPFSQGDPRALTAA